jgi:hypothetical protein
MSITAFQIDATPGAEKITLDGQDITAGVQAVTVEIAAGTYPRVTILQGGAGTITGSGVVTVVRPADGNTIAEAVVDFLEAVDPDTFLPLVESRFTSMASNPIHLTLQTLIELAREATDG